MHTVWGDVEVCDAHIHFFSYNFFSAIAAQKSDFSPTATHPDPVQTIAGILNWDAPPPDAEALAHTWAGHLDHYGVSRAALIASAPGDEASVAAAVARLPD